jgi:hypothetical protein
VRRIGGEGVREGRMRGREDKRERKEEIDKGGRLGRGRGREGLCEEWGKGGMERGMGGELYWYTLIAHILVFACHTEITLPPPFHFSPF